MQVETYEVVDRALAIDEGEREEAAKLVAELGLEGQQRYVSEGEPEAANPYRKMTKEEATVYGALLTRKSKIEDYEDGPIPLRVLQVAAHGRELFDRVRVWYPANADVKDPILVGEIGGEYTYDQYLLARWGESLAAFSELLVQAGEVMKAKLLGNLKKAQADIKADIDAVESMSPEEITAQGKESVSYYGI